MLGSSCKRSPVSSATFYRLYTIASASLFCFHAACFASVRGVVVDWRVDKEFVKWCIDGCHTAEPKEKKNKNSAPGYYFNSLANTLKTVHPGETFKTIVEDGHVFTRALVIIFALGSMPLATTDNVEIDLVPFLNALREDSKCSEDTLLCAVGHILFGSVQEPVRGMMDADFYIQIRLTSYLFPFCR